MKLYDYAGAFAEMFDSFDAICSYEPKSSAILGRTQRMTIK